MELLGKNYDKIEFRDGYCAFLDVLGWSNLLEQEIEKKSNGENPFDKADSFINRYLNALERAGVEKSPDEGTPDGIITQCFSDSIFLTVDKVDETGRDSLYKFLVHISRVVKIFQEEGLFLRGGISNSDMAARYDGNYSVVVSRSLLTAHKIESDLACNPTIVLDPDIHPPTSVPSPGEYLFSWGGLIHLNYAKAVFNKVNFRKEYAIKILEQVAENIKQNAGNVNVSQKYEWLMSYYLWYLLKSSLMTQSDVKTFVAYIDPTSRFESLRKFSRNSI